MEKQETFNTVTRHLLSQNKKSMFDSVQCAYRALGGLRCAVGCLIPDDQYSKDLESSPVRDIYNDVPALREHNLILLEELQRIHDNIGTKDWGFALAKLGDSRGFLRIPELTNYYK